MALVVRNCSRWCGSSLTSSCSQQNEPAITSVDHKITRLIATHGRSLTSLGVDNGRLNGLSLCDWHGPAMLASRNVGAVYETNTAVEGGHYVEAIRAGRRSGGDGDCGQRRRPVEECIGRT